MNKTFATVLGAVALSITALAAQAQTAAPAAAASAATPGIDQRQANQEKRIDNGVASGQLTRREAHRLERQQNRINHAENQAKADGTVTKAERKHLHHMQDHASGRIHRQKHDAQARPGSPAASGPKG